MSTRRSSNVGYTRLVLSACTPPFSAEKRLLVYARLTKTVPVGAARLLPGNPVIQPIVSPPSTRPHGAEAPQLPTLLKPTQPQIPAAL